MRAAFILVGLAALVVMELGTPPRKAKPVHEPLAQTTIGSSVSRDTLVPRDTLTPADRLEIHHVRNEAPLQPISPIDEASVPLVQAATTAYDPPKNINQQKRSATAGKSAVLLPKPRPKQRISRTTVNAKRSRATAEVKSCRPDAFDRLLSALNLSPECES
jgi:hypothetical protein